MVYCQSARDIGPYESALNALEFQSYIILTFSCQFIEIGCPLLLLIRMKETKAPIDLKRSKAEQVSTMLMSVCVAIING